MNEYQSFCPIICQAMRTKLHHARPCRGLKVKRVQGHVFVTRQYRTGDDCQVICTDSIHTISPQTA